jgi:uncharacterized Zn finger protein
MARSRPGPVWWKIVDRPREEKPSAESLRDKLGREPDPVRGEGRSIAETFWGRAWCRNLEQYGDYANRLPRGRTYCRSGAVLDLAIARGVVTASVMGKSLYTVEVKIAEVGERRWSALVKRCGGKLSSLIDLLEGRLSPAIMEAVTERGEGLFPEPKEITFTCSCPDWASMCKHVAAVLYGVGVRFDARPELLFELRGAEPRELVGTPTSLPGEVADERALAGSLSEVFGVTIDDDAIAVEPKAMPRREPRSRRSRRSD